MYFITQSPSDIPDNILAQLGNKVQHALRAYTPKEQKALRAAAQSFRSNPELDAEATLGQLGTGEVLVSLLDGEGIPTMVQRAYVMPPHSFLGVCPEEERQALIAASPLQAKYAQVIDRESAFEILTNRYAAEQEAEEEAARQKQAAKEEAARAKEEERARKEAAKEAVRQQREAERAARAAAKEKSSAQEAVDYLGRSLGRKAANKATTVLINTAAEAVLGGLLGGSSRRRSSSGQSLARGILGSLFR